MTPANPTPGRPGAWLRGALLALAALAAAAAAVSWDAQYVLVASVKHNPAAAAAEAGIPGTRVRAHEYRCLLDQALENLACGISVILTAPFLREYADGAWLRRVRNRCGAHGAALTVVWVKCDVESMSDYLHFRGASRAAWKLANWDEYLAMIDPDFEPAFPHCVVDNRLIAAVALAEQARELAVRVSRGV